MTEPYEPPTQWESITDALPRLWLIGVLALAFLAAALWRRWQVRREQARQTAEMQSQVRGDKDGAA